MSNDSWIEFNWKHDGKRIALRESEIAGYSEVVQGTGCNVYLKGHQEAWEVDDTFDEIENVLNEETEQ